MNFRISNKLVNLIMCYHANTLSKILFLGQISKEFKPLTKVKCELRQVCCLLTLEKIIKNMQENREMKVIRDITLLANADDIIILTSLK